MYMYLYMNLYLYLYLYMNMYMYLYMYMIMYLYMSALARRSPPATRIFSSRTTKKTQSALQKKILFFLFFRLTKSDNALYLNHNPPTT